MTEPATIFAGDSVSWDKTLQDFPAPTWILEYYAVTAEEQVVIPTQGNGEVHSVNLTSATTEEWNPGIYRWVAKVRSGAQVRTVDSGQWEVFPDLAKEVSGIDTRSYYQRIVDGLRAAYTQVIEGHGMVNSYSIGDQLFTFRSIDDIKTALDDAEAELARFNERERIRRGKLGRTQLKVYL